MAEVQFRRRRPADIEVGRRLRPHPLRAGAALLRRLRPTRPGMAAGLMALVPVAATAGAWLTWSLGVALLVLAAVLAVIALILGWE